MDIASPSPSPSPSPSTTATGTRSVHSSRLKDTTSLRPRLHRRSYHGSSFPCFSSSSPSPPPPPPPPGIPLQTLSSALTFTERRRSRRRRGSNGCFSPQTTEPRGCRISCQASKPSSSSSFWWMKGSGKDEDSRRGASSEQSGRANEELLLFFFQIDLTTRLQRALNLEQYEAAQQIREKLVEVDKEAANLTDAKAGFGSSKEEAQDKGITILRLRNDLQKAIEDEDYGGAAELRDQISKLEAETLAAAAEALAYENVEYMFRLGQKVRHTKYGYRGVVCGMDPLCCELERSSSDLVKNLCRGQNQPFYQVLVDMRSEPNLLVTYVAEENLMSPEEQDMDEFDHPYVSFLFYGMDAAGDFIPIKQLREKYNKPRHELPWEEEKSKDDPKDDSSKKP